MPRKLVLVPRPPHIDELVDLGHYVDHCKRRGLAQLWAWIVGAL